MRLVSHLNSGPLRHAKLCVLIKDNIVHFMAVLCVLCYHVQAVRFHRNSRGVCVEVSYFFFSVKERQVGLDNSEAMSKLDLNYFSLGRGKHSPY